MRAFRWKLFLISGVAIGIPCFVLAEKSATPSATPAISESDAQVAADKEPGDGGPTTRVLHEGMHRHERPLVKGTYLGIRARPASEEIRAQFKLPEGTALLIDEIAPDSPAANAGVKKFDVLTKVDDQLIINPEQLSVLIRMHKTGDEVKLAIIHEAVAATVSVTLVEKDMPPIEDGRPPRGGPAEMRGMPPFGMRGGMGGPMGMRGRGEMQGPPGGPNGGDEMEGPGGPRGPFGARGEFGPRGDDQPGPGGPMGGRRGFGMRGGPGGGPDGPPDADGPDGSDDGPPPDFRSHRGGDFGPRRGWQGGPTTRPTPPGGQQP